MDNKHIYTQWPQDEDRKQLVSKLKAKIEAIKIKLYPLENCKTCKDCHYGNNSTFCKHSAYNFPFDSLKLEEGFVDCPYFDEPYDD